MDLSIIIVNYKMKDMVSRCLDSLRALETSVEFEVILVDNDPADGSAEHFSNNYGWTTFIGNRENAGFAKACNQGLARSAGECVLFLNPDTEMPAGTLDRMKAFLAARPEVGIAGCRTVNADGSLEPSVYRFPTPWRTFADAFYLGRWFGGYEVPPESLNGDRTVEVICGACLFARRRVLEEIGSFDEEFWMYGEDVELCYRAYKAGWRVCYVDSCEVVHKRGERHLAEDAYHDIARISYNHYKWIFCFYRKHYPPWANRALRRIMAAQIAPKIWSRKRKLARGDDSRNNVERLKGLTRVMDEFVRGGKA